jgi:hypothetical protein
VHGATASRGPRTDRSGTWFADERGIDRRLKISWHGERGIFVLSLWHRDTCTATFRLPLAEVPRLINALVEVLGKAATSSTESVAGRVRERTQRLPEAWRRISGRGRGRSSP